MSNSTCWLSFFDSSSRSLLPPNNLRDSMAKLFLLQKGKVRLLSSVALTVLMAMFFSQSSFAQELIVNPGFESKLTGWQSNKSPIRTVAATSPVKTGIYSAHINNAYQDNEYFYQNLNASPFGKYSFSAWAMVHDPSKWSSVGVNFYDANWVMIPSARIEIEVNSTSFQKYSRDFTVPSGVRYMQVYGYTESTVLKVDDYSLTQAVGGTPTGTLSKTCKIENFRKCDGTTVGYGPWLNILVNGAGGGSNNEYNVSALTWQEYSDNTATVKGTITKKSDATVAFTVDLLLSGKTTTGTGHFSPVDNASFCVGQKGADWYFYPNATGTLIGTGSSVAGSQINVTLDPSMPWQVGTGGTTRFKDSFGSSAWVNLAVVKQPSTSGKTLSIGHEGTDFYLEMPGCTPVVCNNVTSGGTIGSNQSGCGSFDPAAFTSVANPSGGGTTALEFVWLKSTTSSVLTTATQSQWTAIVGATGLTYDSGPITQTTYFIRCSRRAGCTDYVGESNVLAVTVSPSCAGKDPICLSRKSPIQNSSFCGDATKSYGMWFNDLKGNVASPSQYFTVKSGELTEFCDGTAILTYTACVTGGGANDCISATVNYSGRTSTAPAGSPVANTHCGTYNPNTGDWYYYPTSSGGFTGTGIYAGLTGTYTQNMGAFQLGTGGSLNDISKFGASSWFKINITNGGTNHWTTVSKDGDFNVNLGTSTHIASVTATANPTSICRGENVVLTATIDAASKSANCSPTYSWVGSNGFTSNQATVTNNDVQGATTYTVTVSFTAVNGSKCSVTATTGVALNAVCCDNITNGGQIAGNQRNCGAFDPAPFTNVQLPSGGTGTIEYLWLKSTTATEFTEENAAEWIPMIGTNSPNLDVNNISVTTAYQRCSRRAGCTDYDGETNVIVVIIDKVPNAPTTTPAAICGTGTVTLGATCTTGVAQWYAALTGGTALATGASFTTPSISATTPYYVSCKSPEGCESTPRTEAKATINSDATAPTVTPVTICGTGTATLGATCTTGVAQWFTSATGGSTVATGASFTTPSISVNTTYYVSCKSGAGCESARVPVKATVIGKITDGGKIQYDENICPGKIPSQITSATPASGGDASLAIEYIWLQSTSLTNGVCPQNIVGQTLYTPIAGATSTEYQPGVITQTTCYIRCSRRAGCTDYIGGESNIVKKTLLATCQGKDPICLSRKTPVENSSFCGDATKSYGMYFSDLKGNVASPNQLFSVKSGELTEFCDGTAVLTYTACVVGGSAGDCITATVNYSGRTGTPPVGSPVSNTHCTNYNPNVADWYYYPVSNGTFSGAGIYAGLAGTYTQNMGAFQVGTGGSLNDIAKFGASSWFKINITNGGTNSWTTASKDGDFNINLGTSTTIASVTATANPKAICSGEKVDLTATLDLNSKSANCSPSYSWVGSNGFTSTQATATNTNVTTSTTYTVTVTFTAVNGSKCSVTATTGVTVNPIPNPPTVTPAAICGTGTVTLGATCSTGTAQWYSAATGGASIATGASFTTPSISATATYYVSCKTDATCESVRTPVTATINPIPATPTVKPAAICGTGTAILGATCTTGVAQWYAAATGGASIATGASFTTPSISVTTTYYVSCKTDATCESGRMPVTATVNAVPNVPTVTPATTCGTGSVTLGATCTTGVAQWYSSATSGTALATGASFTTPSLSATTTYYVSCKSTEGCESAKIEVKAIVIVKITDGGSIKADEIICVGGTPSKITSVTSPTGGDPNLAIEYVWLKTTSLTATGTCPLNIVGQNLYTEIPNTNTPDYQPGAITVATCYIRCARRAGCLDYIGGESNTVKKSVEAFPTAPTVTPLAICGTGTVTLGATCSTGATAMWYAASTGGASIATGASFTTPIISATTTYYVSCKTNAAGCESNRTPVTATINPIPATPTVKPAAICGSGTVTLGATCATGTAMWYTGATGGASVSTGASFTTPSITATTTYYVSCKTTEGCESGRTPVTATVNPIPNAPTVTPAAICGTGTVTLGGTCVTGVAQWYTGATGGASVSTGAIFTTPSITATTTYYVSCKTTEGCESGRTPVTATVNPIPNAPTVTPAAICGTGTVTLGATCATGIAQWYTGATGGASVSTGASFTTPSISATTTYYVSCKTTEGCKSDRIPVTATVNPIPNAPTVKPAAICGTGTVTLGGTCATGVAQWYVAATGGASVSTGASFTTPSISATTTYYVSCKTTEGCESGRTPVTATVNPIPNAPTVTPAAICGTGTVTLGGTCATGVAQWYTGATGGASVSTGASFTTPSITATTTYYVSCKTTEGCESNRTPVTATINPIPATPTVKPAAICGTGTVILGATCATGSAMWYTGATGGASVSTGASFTTPSITATTTYYVSCKTTEGCESGRTPVTATVNPIPNAPTVTPAAICGTGTVTLGATCATGTAMWYTGATGGASVSTGASFTTPSISATTTYYVSCKTTEGCESGRTPVIATINPIPNAPTVKGDAICGSGTVTLGATCATGVAQWYTGATGGASVSTGASFTTPSISATTTYYVSCKTIEGCESGRTPVIATVNPIPNAPTVKPAAICGTGTVNLGATCATGVAQWYISATGGASVSTGASFTTPSISATTTYYVSCKTTEGCESGRTPVIATVNPIPNAPTVTPAAICGTGTVTLGGTCATGTAMWYTGATGGASVSTGASFTTPSITATTTYYVSCKTTEGCESGRTPVTATINPIPATPTVKPAAICGTGTVILGATCATGSAMWYTGATGGANVSTGASFTTPSISATTTYYVSCKTTEGCESGRTPVTATVNPIPNAPTTKGDAICGTGTVTLGGTCATGVAQWYTGATGGASVATGASFTTPSISATTTYYVSCKTTEGCESGRTPVIATINPIPNAPTVKPAAICGSGTVTLGATCATGVAQWYAAATGGASISTGASFTTPSISSTTTYYVSCKTTEGCESGRTPVTATVNPIPNSPTVTPAAICGSGTVTLGATCATGVAQWYAAATGGASISTGASFTTPSISSTTTYYVSCKTTEGCESGRTPVTATVNPIPNSPTVTPAAICGTGTVTLGGTCATGVAQWYTGATGGASVSTGASFTTPSISATTTYYVSCKTTEGCESGRTPVIATINPIPNAPTVKGDAICGTGTVTLGATCATGVAQWYTAATGGASVSTGASFTTPSITATTTYYVSCKTTEGCESGRTPVTATVNPIPNAPTVKPAAICGTGTVTLGATCATGVAQWYAAATGGASVSTGASFTTPSISATTTYYVSCKTTEGCESGRTPVTATVNPIPNSPTVTPAAICGTGTVTLGATCATGSAMWYTGATGGASVSTGASFTTPSISATTTYYVSCKTTEGCESGRTPVTATINAIPNAPTVKGAETCGSGSVTLGAICATGVAQWYAAATGGSSIATGASYTTPTLTVTTSYYVSCKSSEGCESGRTEVKAIVIDKITDGGTIKADETICVGGTPSKITSVTPASGGDITRAIEYIWLQTTSLDANGACPANVVGQNLYTEIPGSITPDYQPGAITQTTCYIRCARRNGCTDYIGGESNTVKKTVEATPNSPTVTPAAICGTGTVTLGATCATGVAQWYTAATGGTSISTGASFTTPSISATTTYYVSCKTTAGGCESGRTSVTATINPIPTAPTVKPAAICGTGTVTLGATCTTGTANWYAASTGGASIATGASYTTPSLSATTTYYVSCKSTEGCESGRTPVTATINANTTAPTVTPAAICGTGTVTLGANCATGVAQWYVSATGGASVSTGASFTTPSISTTTTYYVSCKSDAGCESMRTPVTATINMIPNSPTVKGDAICGTGTVTLGATCVMGTANWYAASTGGSSIAMGASYTTPSLTTTTTYYVSCKSDANCESGRTPVTATVNANATAPTVKGDAICGTGTVTLGATCTTGIANWYTSATGGASVATGASYTTPSLSATTTYYVSCKTDAGCESARTPVIATVNANTTAPTGTPAAICGTGTVTLGATCATGTAMWYAASTGGASITTGASFTTPSLTATTSYYVSCKSTAGCESGRTEVKATVNAIPTAPIVKGDAICGSGTVNLGATCATGTANWYAASTGGASIATGASFTTPSLSTTTTYYVSCKSAEACESGRTPVTATVNGNATAPTTTPAAICGTGTVTLGATCTTGSAMWYTGATGGASVSTGASFTTPSLSATTTYYVSCKTDAGCESGRTPVVATVNNNGTAPTVTPAAICGTGTVTLGATCATGTAMWYTGATGGTSVSTGASFITPSLSATTSYYVSCKSTAGCESGRTEVKATINSIPNAPTVKGDAICGAGTITLGATCATGTANWYAAATGGTSVATGASYTTPSISATTIYYVSCKSAEGCESGRTPVTATVNGNATAPTTTPAAICGTGTVTLGATCTTGIANWYTASTGGASVATGASFTTPSLSATTTYYVSCKSTEGCESGRTPVIATINSAGAAPTVTPATTCGTGSVTLGATCSTGTAMWYSSATGGTAIATGASFTTPSLTTTTSYYVSCKSSAGCESPRTEVKATVIGKITDGGTIKADETICAGTTPSKIVNVTLPTGGDASLAIEYIWLKTTSLDANGNCPANVVGQNLYTEIPGSITPDYQPGAITQTTCYVRCARRKGCTDYIGGESNYVKKTVTSPFTISATTNPNAVCNGTTVTVTTTTTATGTITYLWTGPGGFTANTKDLSIPNVTLAANGVYTVTASNGGGCSAVATIHVKVVSCLKIGDLVFNDKNNNGKQDAGELGIAGVTVKLFDSANNQVGSSTTTDANGNYLFSNLPSGTYTVEISAPAGYKSSTGTNGSATGAYEPTTGVTNVNNEDNGTTTSGQIIRSKPVVLTTTDNTNVDFGLFRPAKLGDTVFRDSNGDGIQDAGEVGVAGVTVKLFDSANNVVATTTTDANGKYLFDNLTAGNYTVEFVKSTLPSGLGFSPQGATTGDKDSDANVTTGKTATITLTEGQTNNDIDAGLTGPCDKDVTPPVLSACPYDILLKTRGTLATVSWTAPTATDNCGTPVITSTKTSGSQFPVGKTVVTYTATDSKGNKTTCSFTVTVIKIITCETDTQAPIFYDCPSDINLDVRVGTPAIAKWDHPSVGDNCGIPSVSFNYSPGQVFAPGVTTVIYTAKDAKGNTSYCMFKVTVNVFATLSTPVTESMNTTSSVNAASETVSTPTSTSTPITGATSARVAVVEEVKVGDEVSVYPNPTSSDFSIELSAALMKANSSIEVSVFNMTGTTQFTQTAKGTERISVKVPVENMPNGTYFVNVALDNGRMIIKKLQIVK